MRLKNDFERLYVLVGVHIITTITFVARFIIVCIDFSLATGDAIPFPVVILLLELASSLIVLIGNSLYVFLRYRGRNRFESNPGKVLCCSESFSWKFSTLTCIRCQCYTRRPQFILLTRFSVLVFFEVLRFVAFILACVCASQYRPVGLVYAIVAGLSLPSAIFLLAVEFLHYYRLWFQYRPDTPSDEIIDYNPCHQRFIPHSIICDPQTTHGKDFQCKEGNNCLSENLYHAIICHSENRSYPPERTGDNQFVIGFHPTSHATAYSIARTDFQHSKDGWIGPGTYFTTSLDRQEFKMNQFGAYICAQVDLGKTKRITAPDDCKAGKGYDTVYYERSFVAHEFCVRNLYQIRSWIIVVHQDPDKQVLEKSQKIVPATSGKYVEDRVEDVVYKGCLFQ